MKSLIVRNAKYVTVRNSKCYLFLVGGHRYY